MILFLRDSLPSMHKRTLIDHITYQQKIHGNKSNNTRISSVYQMISSCLRVRRALILEHVFVLYYDAALGYF